MRRFASVTFTACLACQLAQMLAISVRKKLQEFVQCVVALLDQAITPGFNLMHPGGLAMRKCLVVRKHGANRLKFGIVKFAHLLGDVLSLALARDLLGDGGSVRCLLAQVIR